MAHSYEDVVNQLQLLGIKPGRVFLGEIRVLPSILLDDEVIQQYMSGRYDAGPAILVATNRRLILIDKKPFNLTIEDIPYDMISEVEYSVQAFNAYITIHSISKTMHMMSFRQSALTKFAGFVQARVMQLRANNQGQINPLQQRARPQFYSTVQDYHHQPQQNSQPPVQQYYSQQYVPPPQQ